MLVILCFSTEEVLVNNFFLNSSRLCLVSASVNSNASLIPEYQISAYKTMQNLQKEIF